MKTIPCSDTILSWGLLSAHICAAARCQHACVCARTIIAESRGSVCESAGTGELALARSADAGALRPPGLHSPYSSFFLKFNYNNRRVGVYV